MKLFLFSILLIIFTACSDSEITKKRANVNVDKATDIVDQGIFSMCAECHGSDGKNRAFGRSKRIAGWEADRIENALQGYLAGTYGGPMSGMMKSRLMGLSDEDIKEVSLYISKLK